MRTSAIVAVVVGLGMTAAPELVYPDAGAVLAQGKSAERGNGGNGGDRGRSGRGSDTTVASHGNSGSHGGANRGGGKGADWTPPGQAKRLGDDAGGETVRAAKANGGHAAKADGRHAAKANGRFAAEVDGVETELEDTQRGRGSIASALGALNAAHANENALANASPNSRVGRIAAYRDEVLNGQAAEEELEAAEALLDSLDEPERTTDEVEADLRDVQRQIRDLRGQIEDAETEDEIADLESQLGDLRAERRDLAGEYRDSRTYERAEDAVADLTEEVEASEELQLDLLDAAANKEVTDEVVDEVNRLLGIVDTEEPDDTEEVADDSTDDDPLLPEDS